MIVADNDGVAFVDGGVVAVDLNACKLKSVGVCDLNESVGGSCILALCILCGDLDGDGLLIGRSRADGERSCALNDGNCALVLAHDDGVESAYGNLALEAYLARLDGGEGRLCIGLKDLVCGAGGVVAAVGRGDGDQCAGPYVCADVAEQSCSGAVVAVFVFALNDPVKLVGLAGEVAEVCGFAVVAEYQ